MSALSLNNNQLGQDSGAVVSTSTSHQGCARFESTLGPFWVEFAYSSIACVVLWFYSQGPKTCRVMSLIGESIGGRRCVLVTYQGCLMIAGIDSSAPPVTE